MKKIINLLVIPMLAVSFSLVSCNKDETNEHADIIVKSYGPCVVGNSIDYAYILASPSSVLSRALVEASIPGDAGTGFDPNGYTTSSGGIEIPHLITTSVSTDGMLSVANMVDTVVAALRYKYVIPEEARGQTVHFQFTYTNLAGRQASIHTSAEVRKQRIKKGIVLTSADRCYISLKDMAAYTAAEVSSLGIQNKIDLIYNFKSILAGTVQLYGHAFLSPSTNAQYLEGAVVPAGCTNKTKVERQLYTFDRHLAATGDVSSGGYSFIDDIDFETYNPGNVADYSLTFGKGNAMWAVSQDGQTVSFLQVNGTPSATVGTITLSMKSYDK